MDKHIHRRRFVVGSLATALAAQVVAVPGTRAFAQEQGPDWEAIQEALGASGQLMEGDVFRVGMPRTDLEVAVQGAPIKPGFALGS